MSRINTNVSSLIAVHNLNTNNAALRLITCGGPIEGGHYRDNIVVRASLVRSEA